LPHPPKVDKRKNAKVKAIYNLFANEQEKVETEGYGYIKNFPQKLKEYKQTHPSIKITPEIIEEIRNEVFFK